jgi:carbonic anhydrase
MGVVRRALAGFTFANAATLGLATLFRNFRTKNLKERFEFDSLEQCEAAYEQLWDECKPTSKPVYDSGGKRGSKEIGAPDQSDAKEVYHPPEGRSGKPSADKGYDYKNHGEDWGRFGQCAGPNQSPVDVSRYVDVQGQTKYLLWFDYYLDPDLQPDHQATIVNDGHGLRFDVPSNNIDMGFVKIGKTEYSAQEYQFHAPSEHTVDGAVFPLEMQIYNKAHDGPGLVAIAIFFREGESNPFLASLRESAGGADGPQWSMTGSGKSSVSGHFSGAFDLENVIPAGDVAKEAPFYNYEGSLTQPPCTPGVDWWVLSKPITASRDEIRFIRKSIFMSESTRHGNARETQALGNRRIFVGLTGFQHAIKGHVSLPGWKDKDEVQRPRGYSSDDLPWGDHWGSGEVKASPAASPAAAPR